MTFQYKLAIIFMTFQSKEMEPPAKMNKSSILVEDMCYQCLKWVFTFKSEKVKTLWKFTFWNELTYTILGVVRHNRGISRTAKGVILE